jgi:hypothetical protein
VWILTHSPDFEIDRVLADPEPVLHRKAHERVRGRHGDRFSRNSHFNSR